MDNVLLRVVAWDIDSVTGVETVGLDTISPQSSSSSGPSSAALLFATGIEPEFLSRVSRPTHGSEEDVSFLEAGGGIKVDATGVSGSGDRVGALNDPSISRTGASLDTGT